MVLLWTSVATSTFVNAQLLAGRYNTHTYTDTLVDSRCIDIFGDLTIPPKHRFPQSPIHGGQDSSPARWCRQYKGRDWEYSSVLGGSQHVSHCSNSGRETVTIGVQTVSQHVSCCSNSGRETVTIGVQKVSQHASGCSKSGR